MSDKLKCVQSIIFCEEVRLEATGREFAIGIFPGIIPVIQTPTVLPNFVVRFECMFDGETIENLDFQIRDPNGSVLLTQSLPVKFNDWNLPGTMSASLQGFIIPFPGTYGVYVRFKADEKWELCRNLIVFRPDPKTLMRQMDQSRRNFEEQLKGMDRALAT